MKLQVWELVDKTTILLVKSERGLPIKKELLKAHLKECAHVDQELFDNLYTINDEMWEYEDKISAAFKRKNWVLAGKLYLDLRKLNVKRAKVKHIIAKKYDKYPEHKRY